MNNKTNTKYKTHTHNGGGGQQIINQQQQQAWERTAA